MNDHIDAIAAQVPNWAGADNLKMAPIGGLTNTNYRVTVNGESFVLRISGENSALLGINRAFERQALTAASTIGLGPEVVYFSPEGHLVTRFIQGRHWTANEYRSPENLRRTMTAVKRMHALPAIDAVFSPFQIVEHYACSARAFDVPFPQDFERLLQRMKAIKCRQRQDLSPWLGLCHNDLFFVNLLDDGTVRIIDWEFAGMGDIYFDLATLVYAHDTDGPLLPALEEYLLECYFGAVTDHHRARLKDMKFMALFFAAMWGMLQHGMQLAGMVHIPDGFDCLAYAQNTFEEMRQVS